MSFNPYQDVNWHENQKGEEKMSVITGKVSAVKPKSGNAPMGILLNEQWYNTFEPGKYNLQGIQKGDSVELMAEEDGKGFLHISSGRIIPTSEQKESPPTETSPVPSRTRESAAPSISTEQPPAPMIDVSLVQPFSEKQREVLTAKIDMDDVDIRPSGEIYYSQMKYRNRLDGAFGAGAWALIPRFDSPLTTTVGSGQKEVTTKYALVVNGRFVAEAYGSHKYYPNNLNNTLADAIEASRSDALKKCCKDLSIANECWNKTFIEDFKKIHCIQVNVLNKKGKEVKMWRRKDRLPFDGERGLASREVVPEKVEQKVKPESTSPPLDDDSTPKQKLQKECYDLLNQAFTAEKILQGGFDSYEERIKKGNMTHLNAILKTLKSMVGEE